MNLIKPGTQIRATKLVGFGVTADNTAYYECGGIAYLCVKRRGHYFVTASYYYM